MFQALLRFGVPLQAHGVDSRDFEQPGNVYQIGLPPRRIDLLTGISGLTFEEAWSSSATGQVEGRTVHIIGKDALIKNKIAAGRPKDLADVARLTGSRRPRS